MRIDCSFSGRTYEIDVQIDGRRRAVPGGLRRASNSRWRPLRRRARRAASAATFFDGPVSALRAGLPPPAKSCWARESGPNYRGYRGYRVA